MRSNANIGTHYARVTRIDARLNVFRNHRPLLQKIEMQPLLCAGYAAATTSDDVRPTLKIASKNKRGLPRNEL